MQVIKRDGRREPVHFDKVSQRLRKLALDVSPALSAVDVNNVAKHACTAMHDEIRTEALDVITADAAVALATDHPDYSTLAARILVSNMHKTTSSGVLDVYSSAQTRSTVSDAFFASIIEHAAALDDMIEFSRDYNFDYFGFRTLLKGYLLPGERPQHMYMRVAVALWASSDTNSVKRIKETYDALSTQKFTHASPTLFNAGTKTPQLASCFLQGVHVDSLDDIFETFHKTATISKFGGGIGCHVHAVRAKGSLIRSTNGRSDGLVPMLKVANEVVNYVNQSGKRKGSMAIYLEPHHADIMAVLDLKRNQGDEHLRARDLFYAMWISDLFMRRVEANVSWSLFDPGTAPGLDDVWGDAYVALYERYEAEGRAIERVPAQDVWFAILRLQIETGVPYMCYKDAANAKSNQGHLGTIKSSNLCVAGSTRILTTRGYKEIESLEGQQVSVWNGRQFSECTVRKTGTLQKLMRVHFSNGAEIACTPYHKFYISNDDGKTAEEVVAADLRLGQKLAPWDLPTMIPTTDIEREWTSAKLRWLEDVFDDNGYIEKKADGAKSLFFTPKILEKSYLDDLVQMLQTTGVHSTISSVAGCRRLKIDSAGLVHLIKLGFRPQHLDVSNPCGENPRVYGGHSVRVTGLCEQDDLQDTWCFSEPLRHMGMFNGVLTGNCSEIMEYTAPDEIAVCNLGSLSLPAYLVADKPGALPRDPYDFAALHAATKILARNLDRVIDVTFYPVPEASASNARHRPIGIGVQGLADVFFALGVPFDSETAAELNRQIFATIYHAAVETSAELAIELGAHPSHPGSPASRGQLQFDLWGVEPCIVPVGRRRDGTLMRSWNDLRALASSTGLRNSLLLAPMPTASTAQIMGNTEAFEPVTSNLYSRTTLAGTFTVVNTRLMRDLLALGLWTPSLKNQLVAAEGSVQSLDIPAPLKAVYKTAYELSMKTLIDMAADRGAYVDQSMSLNMFVAEPTFRKLSSMHFYAWRKGLKTGMYYLRSKAASGATKITVVDEPAACDACSG